MFKFVVLCAFFAVSIAEPEPSPGAFITSPFAYSAVYPGSTTITKQSSSIIHPPYAYSTYSAPVAAPLPFAHFIKKRSPQYLAESYVPSFYYPTAVKTSPLISTPLYNTPLVTPVAHVSLAATHLIKKRSAPLFPYSYYSAPTTYIAQSAPLIATQYKTPLFPAVDLPVTHYTAAHLIKKRSAQLLPASYVAPSTYITKPLPVASFYSNLYPQYQYPNYYPVAATTHFIKKRSAPILPAATYIAPATYSAATPLLAPKFYSGPIYSTPYYNNPFLYSTYIKK